MPISSPSDLLLNVELSTDIATQDELDSLANSIVGTPEDSGDEMTLNGLKKKDEILSERIGTVEEQASEALAAANVANENASAALEGVSALSGRVSGLEGRVQQVEENVQTLETGVQTAMANAEAAVTTAAGADTKATAAQTTASAAETAASAADTKATTAIATANNAKTTADAADGKAETALTAIGELNGKVATLEQNDAEQDGRLDTIEEQIPNLALKTDIHDGTLQVTVNGAGGFTFTANQAGNTSYDIVVPSTDDFVAKSDFDDLSGRVNNAEGDIDQLQNDVQDLGNRVTDVEGDVNQLKGSIATIDQKAEGAQSTALTAQSMADAAQSAADAAQTAAAAAQRTADGAATSAITNAGDIEQIYSQIGEIMTGYYRYSYNRTPEGQHSQYGWYDSYIGSGECTDLYGNHYFPDGNEYEGGVLYSSDRAQILIGYTSENNVGIWYRTCSERDENGQRIINPWTILDTMKSPLPMYSPYQNLGEWLVSVNSILGSLPNSGSIICQDEDGGSLYKGGNSSNLLQEPPKIQSHQLALVDSIAREYEGSSAQPGQYTSYKGYLYRCISATSGGVFNPNYWKEVSVTDEISDNLSALSSELGNIAAILDNINGVNL